MKKLFNPDYLNHTQKPLLLASILFVFSQIYMLFLPNMSIEFSQKATSYLEFRKYQFANMAQIQAPPLESIPMFTPPPAVDPFALFNLKAVFKESSKKGWVMIESGGTTEIVEVNQSFMGYKLTHLGDKTAIFFKEGKEYSLNLQEKVSMTPEQPTFAPPTDGGRYKNHQKPNSFLLPKTEVKEYEKNPKLIWRNIKINPINLNQGRVDGYEVADVKAGSVFEAIGLRKGDVLVKANNIELKSTQDAINLYKNVEKLNYINLTVRRDGKTMELEYEIR